MEALWRECLQDVILLQWRWMISLSFPEGKKESLSSYITNRLLSSLIGYKTQLNILSITCTKLLEAYNDFRLGTTRPSNYYLLKVLERLVWQNVSQEREQLPAFHLCFPLLSPRVRPTVPSQQSRTFSYQHLTSLQHSKCRRQALLGLRFPKPWPHPLPTFVLPSKPTLTCKYRRRNWKGLRWEPFLNWLMSFRHKARGGRLQYLRDQPLLRGPEKIIWGLASVHGNFYFYLWGGGFSVLTGGLTQLTASDYLQTTAGKSCRLNNCEVWEKRKGGLASAKAK